MRKRTLVATLAGVALIPLIAGIGIAYASIPATDGTVHGCYQSGGLGNGSLYVIDSAASCPTGYTALNWQQTAPVGIAGYQVVSHNFSVPGPRGPSTYDDTVSCPAGKVALAGGVPGAVISWPTTDGTGWDFEVNTPSVEAGAFLSINARVACATEGV
jgi:hypothetical protein